MLRNYIVTAWRTMAASPLYAVLNIGGLALGIIPALLVALFIRHEVSYDGFLPHRELLYLLSDKIQPDGKAPYQFDTTSSALGEKLKAYFPEIDAATRLAASPATVKYGDAEARETVYWADPGFLEVVELPLAAGDRKTALGQPGSVVLTQSAARRYFGDENPIGKVLELNRAEKLAVTAVLVDLPSNSNFNFEMLAAGRSSASRLTALDSAPTAGQNFQTSVYTFIRLRPGAAAADLQAQFPTFLERTSGDALRAAKHAGITHTFSLIAIADLHLRPGRVATMRESANLPIIYAGVVIAGLIVFAVMFNFINLMTARAARRHLEVGIRKNFGAGRGDLITQFLGEAVGYAVLGAALAVLLVKAVTPAFVRFAVPFGTPMLDQWGNVYFWLAVVGFALLLGVGAGAYPAFVLSGRRLAMVFKGETETVISYGRGRQALVLAQFAIFIGLMLATIVAVRQVDLSRELAQRFQGDQILLIRDGCRDGFKDKITHISDVDGVACASSAALNYATILGPVKLPDGSQMTAAHAEVDFGLLEIFGQQPVAGRFFDERYGTDVMTGATLGKATFVINETAVRKFGFASAQAAVGAFIRLGLDVEPSEIVGVAPDFGFDSITYGIQPMVYLVRPNEFQYLVVKLKGEVLPQVMRDIDDAWKTAGMTGPIERTFLDQRIQWSYLGLTRQGQIFGALGGMALFIAALGLFGLAAFTAERRTKEIGIRKAMGARTGDILRLLVWQFTKPVLWANVLAWPLAYIIMKRWLENFASHVALTPWMFLAASALALVIAVLTVAGHAWLVARTQPVKALRYE